jgi:hypothetical protein
MHIFFDMNVLLLLSHLLSCCAPAVFKVSKGATADALSSSAPTTPSTFLYTYCCKAGGATVAAALAVWPVLPQLLNHWFYALCLSLSLGAIWDFWCLVRHAGLIWGGLAVAL